MELLQIAPQHVVLALVAVITYILLWPPGRKSSLDNLPGPPSTSWLSGNMKDFLTRDCWEYRAQNARKYGRISKLHGLFGAKWVQVWDPKALHAVFIKDQEYYPEPPLSMQLLLGPGLLAVEGEQHKRQRKMLTPVFSIKHLRDMMPLFYQVTRKARDAISQRLHSDGDAAELDMLLWMGRTTLEIIGQAGFGHTFDDFTSDKPNEFATAVKSFFPQMGKSILIRVLLPILVTIGTAKFRRRVVELVPLKNVQRLRYISDIMYEQSVKIFNEKKAALARGDEALKHEIGEGRDIMSILLRANLLAAREDRLPDDELIGQVTTMILAGMDTTANSITRILQILSEHQDVQDRLRAEILQAVEMEGDGEMLGFDKLMGLPYLDAVCRESFRVYPNVTFLFRVATKDMILPLSEPMRMNDGGVISELPIPMDTRLVLNVGATNTDPALWGSDASQWRPERWLEPLPKAVEEARIPGVYSHMMTFIGGNRACIGFKFAEIELKLVLVILLQSFKFESTGKLIVWNNAPVLYPTIGKISETPALPLKVSLLHS